MGKQVMWTFETAQFTVQAYITEDEQLDLSWDDDGETAEKLSTGEYVSFGTVIEVTHKPTGIVIGQDSLWGSIYADPREFFTDHRDPDPLNRNSSIMRASKGGNVVICHYFPSLVAEAIADARSNLRKLCNH